MEGDSSSITCGWTTHADLISQLHPGDSKDKPGISTWQRKLVLLIVGQQFTTHWKSSLTRLGQCGNPKMTWCYDSSTVWINESTQMISSCFVFWLLVSVRTSGVMYDQTIFCVCKSSKSDTRPQAKWAVTMVIADGHFNLPQGFVWVCTGKHTHLSPNRVYHFMSLLLSASTDSWFTGIYFPKDITMHQSLIGSD